MRFFFRHFVFVFFFNATATTEIYTLSLHDALPICGADEGAGGPEPGEEVVHSPPGLFQDLLAGGRVNQDRKSTRLNSSHRCISYAVFCLKKKNTYSTGRT